MKHNERKVLDHLIIQGSIHLKVCKDDIRKDIVVNHVHPGVMDTDLAYGLGFNFKLS